tara:strand:+ start:48657 stop:49544 length:888 start_codon:yes stop_codon:yes gene_type:complete
MAIQSLGYIGLGARDLVDWHAYAKTIMGADIREIDDALVLRLDSRDWRIRVEQNANEDILYVGWETGGAEEFTDTVETLKSVGVGVENDPDLARLRGVRALGRFVDPAGIQCELFWGATERFETPFVSPAGVKEFVTGSEGLGHVVFAVADPADYEAFYSRIGFQVSDYIDMSMGPDKVLPISFMHCNPRHHTLAFTPLPSPKKLLHFMLQTADLDDVGRALDQAKRAGVPISMSLGRHSNDHMVSFYSVTPSGFELEYGWGARSIGEAWTVVRHDVTSYWGHEMLIPPGAPAVS